MENIEEFSSEEIALIDLILRKKISNSIFLLDDLILTSKSKEALTKLKEATVEINKANESIDLPDDLKKIWSDLFQKQVRFSVDRAKNK